MPVKTDTNTYLESPATVPLPPAGGTVLDEAFGTTIMRFTDESDGEDFGTTYSVWSTANCNNTKLWIYNSHTNSYFIGTFNPTMFKREGALKPIAAAPARFYVDYGAAIWDSIDPDKLYLIVDAKIYYYRPSTNAYTLLKDLTSHFPAGWYFIQLYMSDDNNRFAAMMKNPSSADQGFMVYDLALDKVVCEIRTTDCNGITMDKSGKYVILAPDIDPNQYIYNVNTGAAEALVSPGGCGPDYKVGHNDTGHDLLVGNDQCRGGYTFRKMSAPHDIGVWVYAPYWINSHASSRAMNEHWSLISTYGEVDVSVDKAKYRRECFQIGVKAPFTGRIRRLFHHRANWGPGGLRGIVDATNASPIVIKTVEPHKFQTGQRVRVSGVGGNTNANGFHYITVIDTARFSLNRTTGNGAYTSGGSAYLETYWSTPRANISRDGKFVFFTSNWGGIPGGSRNDLFIAQIEPAPTGTEPTPSPTPIPSPTPTPTPSPTPQPPQPSPDGTKGVTITDATGGVWTIGTTTNETLRNKVWMGGGQTTEYKYLTKEVYAKGFRDGLWYKWTGDWVKAGDGSEPGGTTQPPEPVPTPTPVPPKEEFVSKGFRKLDVERTALYQEMWKQGYGAWEELEGNNIKFRLFPKP